MNIAILVAISIQDVPDPKHQFARVKRLGHKIVGADIKTRQPVFYACARRYDDVRQGRKKVERATAIIDHMRIFGRKPSAELHSLDPVKMIEASLGLIGEQLHLSNIDVEANTPENYRPFKGHQVQIEQVLLNLLTNARDGARFEICLPACDEKSDAA